MKKAPLHARTPGATTKAEHRGGRLRLAAVGIEAEFELWVDGEQVRPEDLFDDPRAFVPGPLVHRTGTSYQLPTGGAVYFDTGVVEVATPVMELERGCVARAGRSLWESIGMVRRGLDEWEARTGRRARMVGFSAHYNTSFEEVADRRGTRTVERLAHLLSHVLPVPVMLLAANRRSTGVGVRPREGRIEVTVDFTPGAALTVAAGTLVVGVVRGVMAWPSFDLDQLGRRGVPVTEGFAPVPHTTRSGWLAQRASFPRDPFACDIDAPVWRTTGGECRSLRGIGARIAALFAGSIRRVSDPFTFRLVRSVLGGRAPSLLDLPDRPVEYEDVGRLCAWDDLFPPEALERSRYERVIIHAIAGRRLRLAGRWHTPVGMRGWSAVRFRPQGGGRERVVPLDDLLDHLDDWEAVLARGPRR